jgi:hypothetical protein
MSINSRILMQLLARIVFDTCSTRLGVQAQITRAGVVLIMETHGTIP